jgi:hypothetical protein
MGLAVVDEDIVDGEGEALGDIGWFLVLWGEGI